MGPDVPRSTLYFVLLVVGMCVMFTGVTTWLAMADMDYRFALSETRETSPRHTPVTYYETLSPAEQEMFHRAVDEGKTYALEERHRIPGEVIRYEGTYYVFDTSGYYDWLNPRTGGPALLGILGIVIMADAARRDVKYG